MQAKIDVAPDAWATKVECVGLEYGKTTYGKLPVQSLQPGYYSHEKLYSEKTVIGLMKAAYYDGHTEREEEARRCDVDTNDMTIGEIAALIKQRETPILDA